MAEQQINGYGMWFNNVKILSAMRCIVLITFELYDLRNIK